MDPETESDDSDNEDKVERRDSAAMLDAWLAELDSLTVEIDPLQACPLRFSRATLEDTQEDELNAILGELSALQINLDREIKPFEDNRFSATDSKLGIKSKTPFDNGTRTESPDNDSGFSDNASLLSSGSSLSASGSSSGSSTTSSHQKNSPLSPTLPANANEDEKRAKIREALEKMKAASVPRLYVKAFSADGSSKALLVEDPMSCGRVLALLADKNHVPLTSKWALVEHLPHLQMERIYEDHENMVDNLLLWTRDSKNKIFFVMRDEKYDVFNNPQRYLESRLQGSSCSSDRNSRNSLIEEFFNQGLVPEVESQLFLKAEGKKAWKKFPFVLRASGLYYYPKGKVSSNSSKDLVCLTTIDINTEAYQSIGWKKKFKAPTEFGFALKPAKLQVKAPRHIKYLCAEDQETLFQWMVGLRLAKHGKQLWDNFKCLHDELDQEEFDDFRNTALDSNPIQISTQLIRAENIVNRSSGRDYTTDPVPVRNSIPTRKISRTDDSNSTGTATNLTSQSGGREEGFESDAPFGGTIKRKPSTVLSPKIPLTFNTRSLVSEYITKAEVNPIITPSQTLQRKRSVSGNSGSGSTISSGSSSSTLMKPSINIPSVPPQIVPGGVNAFDESEYASLPPPPPELLVGDCEPYCQNQSTPNSISTPPSFSNEVIMCHRFVPRNIDGSESMISYKDSLPKNVSFASELSQRLKSGRNVGTDNLPYTLNTHNSRNPTALEEPTPDFLIDLKRVMEKKWQIAQKCRAEGRETAHEILGFRFEQGSSDRLSQGEDGGTPNSLNNVRAWVSQHYGNSLEGYTPLGNSNTGIPYPQHKIQQEPEYSVPSVPKPKLVQRSLSNQIPTQNANVNYAHAHPHHQSLVIYENIQERSNSSHYPIQHVQVRNKKPPPPIPKRAESTHLSAHFVYN